MSNKEEKNEDVKAEAEKEQQAAAGEVDKEQQENPAKPGKSAESEKPAEPEKPVEPPAEPEKKPAEPEKPAEPDWKDRYARLLADFDNYKKREARAREDTYRYAEADILADVLPIVDNLALALANAKNKDDEFVKGVQLVYDSFLKQLKDRGAEPFDSVGQKLDTERMEAIAHLPSPDVEEGLVSIESKRGWMLKGKVLRAAQVVVSSGKGDAA
ncbi:MAG: nucleotide exchange factor GrpE [Kiritimatiellae bacterium]|nr:nucleotide exchange factor GrpE [Kiritimatiellia bacterium]